MAKVLISGRRLSDIAADLYVFPPEEKLFVQCEGEMVMDGDPRPFHWELKDVCFRMVPNWKPWSCVMFNFEVIEVDEEHYEPTVRESLHSFLLGTLEKGFDGVVRTNRQEKNLKFYLCSKESSGEGRLPMVNDFKVILDPL